MNKLDNDNKRLKAQLAKLLRMEQGTDSFEFVWEELKLKGIIEDWEGDRTTDEDILLDAKDVLGTYRRAIGGRSSSTGRRAGHRESIPTVQDVPVELTGREREAADALRVYLAAHAAKRPLVQRFRRENLPGGRLLTRDEEISEYLAEELGIEPDVDRYLEVRGGKEHIVFPWEMGGERPTDEELEDPGWQTDEDVARILAEEEERQEKEMEEVWKEYMGSHLEMLGEWLEQKYPWENVVDAEVFLISGRPPRLAETLSATVNVSNMTNSINFMPWVSEETVLKAYHDIQTFRLPGEKTLRILHFVSEQADEEGRLPSWSKLLDKWNAANPDERFSPSTGRVALYRAYERAVKALVPPYLPLGL